MLPLFWASHADSCYFDIRSSFACILIRFKFLRRMQQCLKSASLVGFPPTVPRANANPRGSMIMQYIFSQLNKTQAAQPQQAFRGSWGCGTQAGCDVVLQCPTYTTRKWDRSFGTYGKIRTPISCGKGQLFPACTNPISSGRCLQHRALGR